MLFRSFGRTVVPVTYKESDALTIGKGNYLHSGKDVTLIATGIMVNEAMEAAKILADRGIDAGIVDIHTIKLLDEDMILQVAAETGALVTCDARVHACPGAHRTGLQRHVVSTRFLTLLCRSLVIDRRSLCGWL